MFWEVHIIVLGWLVDRDNLVAGRFLHLPFPQQTVLLAPEYLQLTAQPVDPDPRLLPALGQLVQLVVYLDLAIQSFCESHPCEHGWITSGGY